MAQPFVEAPAAGVSAANARQRGDVEITAVHPLPLSETRRRQGYADALAGHRLNAPRWPSVDYERGHVEGELAVERAGAPAGGPERLMPSTGTGGSIR
jgi:hypothetical protein